MSDLKVVDLMSSSISIPKKKKRYKETGKEKSILQERKLEI